LVVLIPEVAPSPAARGGGVIALPEGAPAAARRGACEVRLVAADGDFARRIAPDDVFLDARLMPAAFLDF
jgi:hypothetical protein